MKTPWRIRSWITSGLLHKLLLALMVVSLIPLFLIARFALDNLTQAKSEVVLRSTQDLDRVSFDGLEARADILGQSATFFLRERESDLQLLARLPRTSDAYYAFAVNKLGSLWTIDNAGVEVRFTMPMFREVAFIDTNGQEVLKATNVCEDYPFTCQVRTSLDLVNVSKPSSTLFKNEDYFAQALKLDAGQLYVAKPVGLYVSQESAYAGTQNRGGDRYRGILRYAMPVYEGGKKIGVVTVAVEWLHFMELVAHVAPSSPDLQAEIDPREADFTYIIDPDGWAISQPRHFNIAGVDEQGQPVASINEKDKDDPDNLYRPGNLKQMGFIDQVFPKLVELNTNGDATKGGTLTATVNGKERVLSFHTIPYYAGQFNTKAGFGLIVMSTDGARLHLQAQLLGKRIDNSITQVSDDIRLVAIGTFVVALILALVLAGNVAFPILRLTDAAQEIESGHWDKVDVDQIADATTTGGDEVARLSKVFASMAKQVRAREVQLRQQVQQLQIVIDETKRATQVSEITDTDFFQDLSRKAREMREQRKKSTS